MASITSTTGLISGIDYESLVESLMEIAARPRDLLRNRTDDMESKQVALTTLSALLLSVQYITDNLGKTDLFATRTATSSNSSVLSASVSGSAAKGTYQFTPLRTSTSEQLLGTGVKSRTDALSEGTLTFQFGDGILRDESLDLLDGGEGIRRGKIRITDRSGASAEIDLTGVQDIGDVLEAISENSDINVTAVASGDHIKLVDNTGQTASNLIVQEVSGGSTAESLGLDDINVAADTAEGRDMIYLTSDLDLDELNDGNGVRIDTAMDDIHYQLRDGTEGTIDLSPIISGGSEVDADVTLGDIMDAINAAEPGKLQVEIAADGDRLVLTDLTEGAGDFSVESLYDSQVLADLGLDGTAVDGVITGGRILGGMNTVLLSSLNGGQGLGELGSVDLTDRSGATATVDLSGAETIDDVIEIINNAGIGVSASINDVGNGIVITDTTDQVTGNLIIANSDATETADKLQIAVDSDSGEVDSGDLHFQVVSYNTTLESLNGGQGVAEGSIKIVDSSGAYDEITIDEDVETIGDVIKAINRANVNVQARLNDTGDGILIEDLAGGTTDLQVLNVGSTTTADDLHLTGEAKTVTIEGEETQVIDGSTAYTIELDGTTSLEDLVEQITALDVGVQATILKDSSNNPYHLSLSSEQSGKAGRLIVDVQGLGFTMNETVRGQDALMTVGDAEDGIVISSATNTFADVLPDVTLKIKDTSTSPVTVTISSSSTSLTSNISTFVTNYNSLREQLTELTAYDADSETESILTGDSTALRLETDLNHLLSSSFRNSGSIRALGELGIDIAEDGTLDFDTTVFEEKYAADPDGVEAFFTEETTGFSAQFKALTEQLTGSEYSTLDYRITVLGNKIEANESQIEFMNERLNRQQDLLYLQFYAMESAIAKMQTNLSVIEGIQNYNFEN